MNRIEGPRGIFTVNDDEYEIEGDPNGKGGTIRQRPPEEQKSERIGPLLPFRQLVEKQRRSREARE